VYFITSFSCLSSFVTANQCIAVSVSVQIQFCMTLSHTLLSMYVKCDFPSWGQYTLAGFMLLMLVLFTNFYIHAYIRRSHSKANGDASKKHDDDEMTDAVTNGNGKAHLNGANNGAKRGGSKKIK
jgi:hypothetical protein